MKRLPTIANVVCSAKCTIAKMPNCRRLKWGCGAARQNARSIYFHCTTHPTKRKERLNWFFVNELAHKHPTRSIFIEINTHTHTHRHGCMTLLYGKPHHKKRLFYSDTGCLCFFVSIFYIHIFIAVSLFLISNSSSPCPHWASLLFLFLSVSTFSSAPPYICRAAERQMNKVFNIEVG